jgi:alpha-glucosidase
VIYQIFPERFAIGKPLDSQTKLAQPAYQRAGYTRHAKWDEEPTGGSDFFGGDLRGVIDHLDYLQDLGAEAVYLTPIFTAYSNHKYDTVDYQSVDPMFGDEHVLGELIDGLHQRGMRLIMDAVLNHVGTEHAWFQAARRDEKPYRDFFTFLADGKYLCWWGYDTLPELRLEHPLLARLLYRDPDSILQRWLARGLDDWRFDAALDVGLGPAADIRSALAERFPRACLIGEVLSFGSEFCAGQRHFHGVMNYAPTSAPSPIITSATATRRRSARGTSSPRTTRRGSATSCRMAPLGSSRSSCNSPCPASRSSITARKMAWTAAKTRSTAGPCAGKKGTGTNRSAASTKQLVEIRRSRRELREGGLLMLGEYLDGDALAFVRHTEVPNQEALVVVNKSKQRLQQRLLVPHTHFEPKLWFKNLLAPDQHLQFYMASFELDLPPESAAIYVPDDGHILPSGSTATNYAYFKPRILGANWP